MEPVVQTSAGDVRGERAGEGWAFLGIPFAQAPIGQLRYRDPVPASPWSGVRDARQHGPSAPQPAHGFTIIPEPVIEGEECLNLNVFTPEPEDARLPVLVWIHGGGFVSGTNASPWYRGERFARDGIVVVGVNYRLGAEGFLALDGAPANRGVLDWICALRWVQENIGAFGGDPARVTIAGQSAGGTACAMLLAADAASGLFHQAILMSGAAHTAVSEDEAKDFATSFAAELGVPETGEAFAGLPVDRVLEVQERRAGMSSGSAATADPVAVAHRLATGALRLAPWIDGEVLSALPIERLAAGAGAHVPVLVGNTTEEFAILGNAGLPLDSMKLEEALEALGLAADGSRAYLDPDKALLAVLAQAITDRLFRVPTVRVAEARAAAPAKTYVYEFGWRSPALGGMLGAGHCLDIPFAFDNLDAEGVATVAGDDPPQGLAERMHAAWVRFIKSGDPGWPEYLGREARGRSTMLFGPEQGAVDDPLKDVRIAWEAALPVPSIV